MEDVASIFIERDYNSRFLCKFEFVRLYPTDRIVVHLDPVMGEFEQAPGYTGGEPMFLNNWKLSFDPAHGGYRMMAQLEMEKYIKENYVPFHRDSMVVDYGIKAYLVAEQKLWNAAQRHMDQYRSGIQETEFRQIEADVHSELRYYAVALMSMEIALIRKKSLQIEVAKITDSLLREEQLKLHDPVLRRSTRYINNLADLAFLNVRCKSGYTDLNSTVRSIQELFQSDPELRDRLLVDIMLKRFAFKADGQLLSAVLGIIQNVELRSRLTHFRNLLNGEALDFTLPDVDGKQHRLSDFKGRYVLVDFWYASCAPCRAYLERTIRPLVSEPAYRDNLKVVMVSIDDKSEFSRVLPIIPEDVVAVYTEDQRSRHPVIQRLGIRGYPHPILIDREGKIVASGTEIKTMESIKHLIKLEDSL